MLEHYESLLSQTKEMAAEQKEKLSRLSMVRMILFVLATVACIIGITDSYTGLTVAAIAGFLVFFVVVCFYQKLSGELAYQLAREQVIKRYCSRLKEDWKTFPDTGEHYLSPDKEKNGYAEEAYDLDIFGKASLYQYMNVATSKQGQDVLCELLVSHLGNTPKVEKEGTFYNLEKRQQAVKELIDKEQHSLHLETVSYLNKDDKKPEKEYKMQEGENEGKDKETPKKQDNNREHTSSKVILAVTVILLLCTLLSVILAAGNKISWQFTAVLICIQFVVSQLWDGMLFQKTYEAFPYLRALSGYEPFFTAIIKEDYECDLLKEMKDSIGTDSLKAVKKLRAIKEMMVIRHNPIVYGLLCSICLYNSFVYLLFVSWKNSYQDKAGIWMTACARLEALLSLCVPARVRKEFTFAVVEKDTENSVQLVQMKHPLLLEEKAVANDCSLNCQVRVITGSNMSGKTTYLRTLGINAVLAYAGAPVCANTAVLSDMQIFTSMRVMDDVSRGISTFYAEVLRIKKMVVYSKTKQSMLALIDEIFKGTNSADRIVGARGVITALCKPWVNAMVSTHDFELCSLSEQYDQISNFHFDEYFEEDNLRFDYQIKQGRCQTTNALHILKMAGIYEERKKENE